MEIQMQFVLPMDATKKWNHRCTRMHTDKHGVTEGHNQKA